MRYLLRNGGFLHGRRSYLADVDTSVELLQGAGCTARWQGSDITVQGVPSTCRLAPEAAARMRASILFCAPLLARLGRVETVLPGGCRIGARPVDLHLSGLAQMGVHCREEGARLILTTPAGLHGADITLGFPSVGATETLLLAAAAAQGETVLRGAAREPEISDLAAFLNRCGGEGDWAMAPADSESAKALQLELAQMPDALQMAYRDSAPNVICAYAYELAGAVNRFYHETRILAEPDKQKQAGYLALIRLARRALEECIDLLGFSAPDRM